MREMGLFPQPFKNKGFLKTILHFILHKTKIQQKNIQRAGNRFRRKKAYFYKFFLYFIVSCYKLLPHIVYFFTI